MPQLVGELERVPLSARRQEPLRSRCTSISLHLHDPSKVERPHQQPPERLCETFIRGCPRHRAPMQTHPVQNVNYWQVAAHKVGLGHRAPQRCRRLISLPTRCWREQDSNHRSRRLGFFGSGLGSARFLPLGSPFRGAGCPCGLGASRCCLALGPQLFGLNEMIEPLPSFPGDKASRSNGGRQGCRVTVNCAAGSRSVSHSFI